VGVVIGTAPLVIAVIFPLANGRAPAKSVIAAAVVVTAGAAIAQADTGNGQGWSVLGLLLSLGALAGIVGSTVLAAPLLPRLGGVTVTVYACGIAAAQLLVAAALVNMSSGTEVLRTPTRTELAALLYLAVAVTAVVFLIWFAAMERLGVERLGLFNGLIPIASLIAVAISSTGTVTGVRVLGALAVLAGLVFGLSRDPATPDATQTRTPAVEHA
jgi:drug/metabolite transporter (DMT)-like permease